MFLDTYLSPRALLWLLLTSLVSSYSLNQAARNHGKLFFGTAADIPGAEQQDQPYMTILNNTSEWGSLTPTNFMKWEYTEPQPGVFNYAPGTIVLDIARDHGKLARCHNLVWSQQLPDWVVKGNWTNATLTAALRRHITNLVTHWSDRCYAWDVVNEAFNDDGTSVPNVFYNVIGWEYVPLAFQFASQAVNKTGKDIKLFYNDYSIEWPNQKSAAVVNLIKILQSRKIQIDGIGLQSHFLVGSTPSRASQIQAMTSYTDLGVDVHQTEMDIRFTSLPPTTDGGPSSYQQQSQDYYGTVSACMAVKRCTGMNVWDFDDKYSWIPPTYPGQGEADLYFANLTRKPAHLAVWQAIQGKPCTVCQ